MKRGLVLTGVWVLGMTVSVAFAFAAVGRVATRVAPSGVARLSASAVERELDSTVPTGTTTRPSSSSTPPSSGHTSQPTVTAPPPTTVGPATTSPHTTTPPTTSGSTPTTASHNTVTTAEGGTLWTRCSGADAIVFVAAVPRSEFERTRDIEKPGGIEQWFEGDDHRSKIKAECSGGVVHAEVEEEDTGERDD